MTVREGSSVALAVRGLVRRVSEARARANRVLPRLRVVERAPGQPPTVWMITPDWDRPSGGIRKQYRAVDVLNAAGVPSSVVHRRSGFACSWFEHTTRITAASDVAVSPGDVIAIPEIYGESIPELPPGVSQVIFNQGVYLSLDTLLAGRGAAAYRDNHDLAAVVVVSEDSADVVRYAFPDVPVTRIRHGVDPAVFHPPATPPGRRIAYMTRRRGHEADLVLKLLELRGALEGWDVVAISGMTEAEVAGVLRSSQIFLSFGRLEGFGLPPLEALASGCLVVGFHGFGGRELFGYPFAVPVEDGDVVAFSRAVEDLVGRVDADSDALREIAADGARFALDTYSLDAERQDLVNAFKPLLSP